MSNFKKNKISKFIKVSSSKQKFIKIALDGEENQIPNFDSPDLIDNSSEIIDSYTEQIWSLIVDFENQLMYNKPEKDLFLERQEYSNDFLNKLSDPSKMNPFEYMDFLQLVPVARKVINRKVFDIFSSVPKDFRVGSDELNQAMNLQEIYLNMENKNTNPFNYDEIRDVVSEVVTNNFSGRF